ncbi:MAG: OPT/YSL family transporter [Thermoproteota archaeon]
MTIENSLQYDQEFKAGFSSITLITIFYGALVLVPIVIFSSLYVGASIGGAAPYIMIIIITQMAVLLGRKPFTKQEVLVAYVATSVSATYTGMGIYAIFNTYMRSAPGIKIAKYIPEWAAVQLTSPAFIQRTLLHPDWIPFIMVDIISTILWQLANMSLGLLAGHLYHDVEKLTFPMAIVGSEAVITLSEREQKRIRYFTLFLIPGVALSILIYGLPMISGAITRRAGITLVPIPWVDLTRLADSALPGSAFGISTDPLVFAIGFIVPFNICFAMLVGAVTVSLIGNSVLYSAGLLPRVFRGMSITMNFTYSYLDFWASPMIGLTIAAALIPLLFHREALSGFLSSFKGLTASQRSMGYVSPIRLLVIYAACSFGTVLLTIYLCPDFMPYFIIATVMGVIWPFIFVMAQARGMAVSGISLNIPYVWEGILGVLPYDKVDIWFAPLYTSRTVGLGSPTAEWSGIYVMARRTQTKISSIIKAWFIAIPITRVMTWLFTSAFWTLAPIPSTFYPFTAQTWPMNASITDLYMSKTFTTALNTLWIVGGVLIGGLIYITTSFLKFPNFLMGFVLGASGYVPITISIFIGALFNRFLLSRFMREKWNEYKNVAVAGLTCGEGIVLGFSALFTVMVNSLISIPY